MKTIIVASLIAAASAFAPSQQQTKASSSALNLLKKGEPHPFKDEVGATAPLGVFDPMGLTADGNKAQFDKYRYYELKHGRVAMLGVVGYLVTYAGIRFPGAEDIPAGWAAWGALPTNVLVQMGFTWGVMEAFNRDASDIWEGVPEPEFEGDFRNGHIDFGWDKQTDAWKLRKRNTELNQGRAAQMGMMSLMIHDYLGNVDEILPKF